jgi:hypothetical protein
MCKKTLADHARQCPRCATDLSLLVDYVTHLEGGLERAQALTRQGELGEAMWAYLAILEVDPDNADARRQVAQVATAVRQFDEAAPGRRWLKRLRRHDRFRRWMQSWQERAGGRTALAVLALVLLVLIGLAVGYVLGYQAGQEGAAARDEPRPSTSGRLAAP